jgi:hypothetical protein
MIGGSDVETGFEFLSSVTRTWARFGIRLLFNTPWLHTRCTGEVTEVSEIRKVIIAEIGTG